MTHCQPYIRFKNKLEALTIQQKWPVQISGIFACWMERSGVFPEIRGHVLRVSIDYHDIPWFSFPSCFSMNDSNNIRDGSCTDALFTKSRRQSNGWMSKYTSSKQEL